MDFANQTALYLSGQGPLGPSFLKTIGIPGDAAKLEVNYFDYRDGVALAPIALGTISTQAQLFSKDLGSNLVRSLKTPLTADSAYILYGIFAYVDFVFPTDLTLDPDTALYGPMLATAAHKLLSATRVQMNVSNKVYLDSQLAFWANYELPSIVHPLKGQTGNTPFAQFPASYNQHHRVFLELSPPIPWPAQAKVDFNITTNVAAWAQDMYGANVNLSALPYTIPIGFTMEFNVVGNQVRVIK